jgi:hypothetical protein
MRALHVLFYMLLIACGSSQHGGPGGPSTCVDDLVDHKYVHGGKGRHNDPEDVAQRLGANYPPDEIVAAKASVDAKLDNNLSETVRMIHGQPTLTGHHLIVEKNYDNAIAVAGARESG